MRAFSCWHCGSLRSRKLFPARDRLCRRPGEFWIVRCRSCGLLLTWPVPDNLGEYYPAEDYGPHRDAPLPREPHGWGNDGWVLPLLPAGSRILELGCGRGDFLRIALRRGWRAEGVETAPAAAERARRTGAPIHERPLEQTDLPDASFDAVFAWMVLEHLEDPGRTLREIRRILRPGGRFLFSVPDAGSWEFSLFGPRWYSLECPRHLTHFDRGRLDALLRRSGLRPVSWRSQRNTANIIGSLGYLLEDLGLPLSLALRLIRYPECAPFVIAAALYPLACTFSALQWGGRWTIAARKEPDP